MKPLKGFIVYPTYETREGKTIIQLLGRLENGDSFVIVDTLEPYLYVKTSEIKTIKKVLDKYKVEETNLKTFDGEKVSKISAQTYPELNKLHDHIKKLVDTYEADVKPHFRYMYDKDILGNIQISGDYEISEKINRIYHKPEITKVKDEEFKPKLKIASIDIETTDSGKLACIGIKTDKINKVFMVTNHKLDNVITCPSEEECLENFKKEFILQDPDIVTGWNLIDFDLKYLQALYKKNKIPLDFGRDNSSMRLRLESNFFRSSSADLSGRQVVDALSLIRDPFIQEAPSIKFAKFDTYTLEDVSQVILGKGKLIKGKLRHEEINSLYKKNTKESHQTLADYNLMDCQLVYDILEKTKMIELAIERSQLTGMPFDKLTASIAAFDSLYIRQATKDGLVSPTTRYTQKEKKIIGGFVKESTPGIYHNILILDFKSLYPSILKTFNIDPASYLGDKKEKGAIEAPNEVYFRNNEGVLPKLIHKLHEAREKAKKEKRELSSYAIKIIMNSFWGVLASPNCRYFDYNMASAITSFARFIIQLTAKEIESEFKVKVLYSDTDSVFVESKLDKDEANKLGIKIQNYINKFYSNYVHKNYNRKSYLELEFQKQYLSFMQPRIRGKSDEEDKGAKKRYAGLVEKDGKEEIEIVGLEAIRGDWVAAAQEFQIKLLDRVFHKQEIDKFIKDYITDLKEGKMDKKLLYRKSIRKDLTEYTKTTPPHVKAARLIPDLKSNIIEYYITTAGPEPIQAIKHKIDYDHYIEKQIKPIANQVLHLLNKDLYDSIKGSKQSKLF